MELLSTKVFDKWREQLRDTVGKAKIALRLVRLEEGNPGDVRSVGEGVTEMRIDFGPGYRLYYIQRGSVFVLLLCGGDKSSQSKDIERAKVLAAEFKEQEKRHATGNQAV